MRYYVRGAGGSVYRPLKMWGAMLQVFTIMIVFLYSLMHIKIVGFMTDERGIVSVSDIMIEFMQTFYRFHIESISMIRDESFSTSSDAVSINVNRVLFIERISLLLLLCLDRLFYAYTNICVC